MNNNYIIITPAHNEENYIEKTIHSVVNQSVLPKKWIIVNDNSTDNTEKIVRSYSQKYDFISVLNINENKLNRSFSSKAYAFNTAVEYICNNNYEYEYIGNIDADISFCEEYFQTLIDIFNSNSKIGIAGGYIIDIDINGKYIERTGKQINSVAGAVQLFRKGCFKIIGKYHELKYGGIDTVAEFQAKMNGWEVKTIKGLKVQHHRKTGESSDTSKIQFSYRLGKQEYSYGSHIIFEFIKCISLINKSKPYLISSIVRFYGYLSRYILKEKLQVDPELSNYVKNEQLKRLKTIIKKYY